MYIKLQYISTIPSRNIYQTRFLAFLQKMGDDGMFFFVAKRSTQNKAYSLVNIQNSMENVQFSS